MAVDLKGLGAVTVVTAGTAVPLSATQIITPNVVVQALSTNTGKIFVGGSNVSNSANYAAALQPGESLEITGPVAAGSKEEEVDLSRIYIDASSSGDQASVGYFARRP